MTESKSDAELQAELGFTDEDVRDLKDMVAARRRRAKYGPRASAVVTRHEWATSDEKERFSRMNDQRSLKHAIKNAEKRGRDTSVLRALLATCEARLVELGVVDATG